MDYVTLFTNDNSIFILFIFSFLGGLIASVSPCSLSMLPIIIGYVGGFSNENPFRTFIQMLFFVFGTSIVFTVLGIICALTGKVFVSNPYFTLVLSSIIMIMGLKLVGFLDFQFPTVIKEMPKSDTTNMYLYPILLGGTFALVGSPCSTPILAGIMAFASLNANIINAVIMLFLFSLAQGVILILAGCLTAHLKKWNKFYKISDVLMNISGIFLILVSLYIFYKIFSPLIVK